MSKNIAGYINGDGVVRQELMVGHLTANLNSSLLDRSRNRILPYHELGVGGH